MAAFREFIEREDLISEGKITQWVQQQAQRMGPSVIAAAKNVAIDMGMNFLGLDSMSPQDQNVFVQQLTAAINKYSPAAMSMVKQVGSSFQRQPQPIAA